MSERTCSGCGETKPLDDFYLNRGQPMAKCKACHCTEVRRRRRLNEKAREYDRQRAKRPERKKKTRIITARWRDEHPEAYRAQTALNNAVRDGKIKKGPCWFCSGVNHVHGHHRDYSKPLDVTWVCARCHHRMHALVGGAHKDAA